MFILTADSGTKSLKPEEVQSGRVSVNIMGGVVIQFQAD